MGEGPISVARILSAVVERASGMHPGRARAARRAFAVFEAFQRIGPPLAQQAEPTSFRKGRLTLRVSSSVWLTELGMMQRELMNRINALLPEPWVTDLRLVLGGSPPPRRRSDPGAASPKLSPALREQVQAWSAPLRDEALKAAFEKAAGTALSVRPSRNQAPFRGPPGPRVMPVPLWVEEDEAEEPKLTYGYGNREVDRWKLRRREEDEPD